MSEDNVRSSFEFRRAQTADFESLIRLQNANLSSNLSDDQKRDGFLSVSFTREQFVSMNNDVAVIVGVEENTVRAYLCASTVEFNIPFALPKAMIDRFPSALFESKPLSDWCVCIAGPACIETLLRGHGVLKTLYECLCNTAPVHYTLAAVFVSLDNPRSIRAAHEKLGMQIVDEFDFNSRRYVTMVGRMNVHRTIKEL